MANIETPHAIWILLFIDSILLDHQNTEIITLLYILPTLYNFKNKLRKIGTNEEQFISKLPYVYVAHQNSQYMKKFIISILFISIILGITLINITLRKDATNIDIKIQNIEALAADESGEDNPCKVSGYICMFYDDDFNPVFYPGLALE